MPKSRDTGRKRERVLRLIHLCRTVKERGVDPFEVDIKDKLDLLDEYLPGWEVLDDLSLDAEALNRLATVIELQSGWVKYRSSLLYVDPLLIEFKVRALDTKTLYSSLVKSWRPVVEYEQLSPHRVQEAIDYWNRLPSLKERFRQLPSPPWTRPGTLTIEEMLELGVFTTQAFEQLLLDLAEELGQRSGRDGSVAYWDFIYAPTYEETVKKAYLTSFLVTYGYARLELRGLGEEAYLKPALSKEAEAGPPVSSAVPVDYDDWLKAGEARRVE